MNCEICAIEGDHGSLLPGWRKLYGLPEIICEDCLGAWHDGMISPDEIKEFVELKRKK